MGGSATQAAIDKYKANQAHRLLEHPGFELPEFPKTHVSITTFDAIVEWALECTARFISPSPKEDNEDEEFSCDDIVDTIRTELIRMLKSAGPY